MNINTYLNHAITSSNLAKDILLKYYRKTKNFNIKDKAGIVTIADIESEELLKTYFNKHTPEFSILAEESGLNGLETNKWIIDPLDGTTNFYHGFAFFCISIALELEGEIVLAVVNNPITNDIYHAIKGKGAYKNDEKLNVSKCEKLENAFIGTGFAYMKGEKLKDALSVFEKISNICHGVRRPGSAVLDLCMVAEGVYDAFYEETLNPWDVAAGVLLVKEAGGKITTYENKEFNVYDKTLLASNNLVHDEIIAIIN